MWAIVATFIRPLESIENNNGNINPALNVLNFAPKKLNFDIFEDLLNQNRSIPQIPRVEVAPCNLATLFVDIKYTE